MTPRFLEYDLSCENSTYGPRYKEDEVAATVSAAGRSAEGSAKHRSDCSVMARAVARMSLACPMIS
jgi:hypothetical protein